MQEKRFVWTIRSMSRMCIAAITSRNSSIDYLFLGLTGPGHTPATIRRLRGQLGGVAKVERELEEGEKGSGRKRENRPTSCSAQ